MTPWISVSKTKKPCYSFPYQKLSPNLTMDFPYLNEAAIQTFIESALKEDIGSGDISSEASVPANNLGKAYIIVKEPGVIAGLTLASAIFKHLNADIHLDSPFAEGDLVQKGDVVLNLEGNIRAILAGERLVLNCMQRMSGVATYTRRLVDMIQGTKARLLDTRKTTPNFRMMEKWAVAIGGGSNHRLGLYDMVMLKDNHIDYSGGITKAIHSTQEYLKQKNRQVKIEIEVRNLDELQEVLETGGVDVVMLDNMDSQTLTQAVQMVNGKIQTEASGGIDETNILEVAKTGVDFISVGALTHSYKSIDLSLRATITH